MVGRGGLHADGSGAQYSGNEALRQTAEQPGSEAGMKALEADAVHKASPLSAQATHVLWSTSTTGMLSLEHDLWRPCPLQGRGRC